MWPPQRISGRAVVRILLLATLFLGSLQVQAADFAWAKRMGDTSFDEGYSTTVDGNGNIYVTGYFSGTADFGSYNLTSAGDRDIFVEKLDSTGTVLWAKRMGGAVDDRGTGIVVDGNGNIYVTGYFWIAADFGPYNLTAAGMDDVFVEKLDSTGTVLWAKRMGGTNDDYGRGMAVDQSGNLYVTGHFQGTANFDTFILTSQWGYDIFVAKLSNAGPVQWAKRMGGGNDEGEGIATDVNGNTYVTGTFENTADFGSYHLTSLGSWDIFVEKLDNSGTVQWARRMGAVVGADVGYGIATDEAGNTYVTGVFGGTADFGTYNLTSVGNGDIFVTKLDSGGTVQWAKRMGDPYSDYAYGISLDTSGNMYVTGNFSGLADFGAYTLAGVGYWDVFVEKLDSTGTVLWAKRMGGGTSSDYGRGIAVDGPGNIYVTGSFGDPNGGVADFGPYNLNSLGSDDIFVTKIESCVPSITGSETYGKLLFPGTCAKDASALPGSSGTPYTYSSLSLPLWYTPNDHFYLSSASGSFAPLIVDDAVAVDGVGTTLGPYSYAAGVPPFKIGRPMEENLVPEPPYDFTSYVPAGQNTVIFELVDTQREIYGNTAVFLLRDCGVLMDASPTDINFISHDDQLASRAPEFDVRYGLLSDLRADRNFSRIMCLGHFYDTPGTVTLPDPTVGQGYYFLVRGISSTSCNNYGDSTLSPDPRDALNSAPQCP